MAAKSVSFAIRYEEQDIYLKCCNPRIERESVCPLLPHGLVIDVYQYKYKYNNIDQLSPDLSYKRTSRRNIGSKF
jgi:hypothetical protein